MRDELLEISGVGDKTADKIMEVVEAHGGSNDVDVEDAIEHLEAGKAEHALEILRGK